MIKTNQKYDLEERTAKFGEDIIEFCKNIKINTINKPIISQFIRSATSVGANYCEANGASSKQDFKNKIHICKKEVQETKFWIRMIVKSNPEIKEKAKELWKEAQELTLIFSKIISSLKGKNV
jgi:four helix bundle protein